MGEALLVTGRTRVTFMIGAPVTQTRAPDLFNRRFRAAGIDRIVVPVELRPDRVASFFAIVRGASNCDGVIATVPLKPFVFANLDEPSARARDLGLANIVRRRSDGSLAGDMTDGPGFWNGAAAHGFDPAGRRIALAGAGAAATAIALEFARRGGGEVCVVTKEIGEFERLARIVGPHLALRRDPAPADLAGFDAAINATPIGMAHAPGTPFPDALLASLPKQALVADAVTDPAATRLLLDAQVRGLAVMAGEEMTRGQFALMGEFLGILEGTTSV